MKTTGEGHRVCPNSAFSTHGTHSMTSKPILRQGLISSKSKIAIRRHPDEWKKEAIHGLKDDEEPKLWI